MRDVLLRELDLGFRHGLDPQRPVGGSVEGVRALLRGCGLEVLEPGMVERRDVGADGHMRDSICAAVSLAQVATSAFVCDAILGSVFGTEDGHGVSLSVFAGERRRDRHRADRPPVACVRARVPRALILADQRSGTDLTSKF